MLTVNRLAQVAAAALPVLLSPLILFAVAEGWINLGGGEKDVLLIIPYYIGTLTFFLCALVLIVKRWPLRRWLMRAKNGGQRTIVSNISGNCSLTPVLCTWLALIL